MNDYSDLLRRLRDGEFDRVVEAIATIEAQDKTIAELQSENARLLQLVLLPGTIPFNWKELEAECAALREHVAAKDAEIVRLGNDCERERVRLAACGVVALANTRESAAQVRPPYDNDDYAYSASLDDVAGAVDEQIEQRERAEQAEADSAALRQQNINLDKATDELYRWLDAKEADNAALRKDAERYRWLRLTRDISAAWKLKPNPHLLFGLELDAAIDAAMREGKE